MAADLVTMSPAGRPTPHEVDALVVGGGPAGLSAALYLARYNRDVLVFDSGHGRSTHHQTNRNYLGFPDGVSTLELRELGQAQLARYSNARVLHHTITSVDGDAERGFTVRSQGRARHGRTLLWLPGCSTTSTLPRLGVLCRAQHVLVYHLRRL